jgi:hypothetical protein
MSSIEMAEILRDTVVGIAGKNPSPDDSGKLETVDCHFVRLVLDTEKAQRHRAEFISIIKRNHTVYIFEDECTHIDVAEELSDPSLTFPTMAMGHVLKLWKVLTPKENGPLQLLDMQGHPLVFIRDFQSAAFE